MFASCLELVRPTANHIQPACQPAHDPPAETRRAFSARRRRRALVAGNVARCRISTRVRFSTIPARVASLFAPILALTGPVTALGQAPKPADASAPVRELAPGTDQPVAPGGRPTHAIAMGCWTLAERWVRAFDAPDGAQAPAIDGAALTLRHDGRTVGRAAIMAPRDAPATDRERILARVVAAALADARRRLALPADALEHERLTRLASEFTLSLEVAGPPVPFRAPTYADVDLGISPGAAGLGVRLAQGEAWVFPGEMLAAGMTPGEALRSAIAAASADATLALPGSATGEPGALAASHGATFLRFRAAHLAQTRPAAAPYALHRAGVVAPPPSRDALVEFARGVTDHLTRRLAGEPLASEYPTRLAEGEPATRTQAALAAYALARASRLACLSPASREAARAAAEDALLRPARAREFKRALADDPAYCAAWMLATAPDALGERPGLDAIRAVARGMLFQCFDPERAWAESVDAPVRPLVALALAREAMATGDAGRIGHARAAVRSLFVGTPPAQLVAGLPWLGWAELELAGDGAVGAADALIELRDRLYAAAVDPDEAGDDDADLAGGFVFAASGQPYPTWHGARSTAFLATMAGDPRLSDDRVKELARLSMPLRFLRQLAADDAWTHACVEPERALWGVRAAPWDPRQPLDASSLALLALTEALGSMERIEREAGAAPAR